MNQGQNRDELFIVLALRAKILSPAQADSCRKIRDMMARSGVAPLLPEILVKNQFLTADQVRILTIAHRYEVMRLEDEALADFLVRKGHLEEVKASACLDAQDDAYEAGAEFPRLEQILLQKGYFTAEQLSAHLRARTALKVPAVVAPRPSPSKAGADTEAPRGVSPKALKQLEAGLKQDTMKVAFGKEKIVDDLYAAVLILSGSLDGHTSIKFDEYLQAVTSAGFAHLILHCGRLEYLSSAGIGVLAATIKRCRDGRGDVRLCGVEDKMRRVMQIIGLLSLVKVYDDEKAAAGSFKT